MGDWDRDELDRDRNFGRDRDRERERSDRWMDDDRGRSSFSSFDRDRGSSYGSDFGSERFGSRERGGDLNYGRSDFDRNREHSGSYSGAGSGWGADDEDRFRSQRFGTQSGRSSEGSYGSQSGGSQNYGSRGFGSEGMSSRSGGYSSQSQRDSQGFGSQQYGNSPYNQRSGGFEYGRNENEFGQRQGGYGLSGGMESTGRTGQTSGGTLSQRTSGQYGSSEYSRQGMGGFEQNRGFGSGTSGYGSDYGSTGSGNLGSTGGGWGSTGQGFGTSGSSIGASWGSTSDRQSFRGRGPKGFQRSDERIREMVSERLEEHDEIDASDIEVTVTNGEVTLSGTAPDRHTKRLAEDIIENMPGVRDISNNLKVKRGLLDKVTDALLGSNSETTSSVTQSGTNPRRR